MVTIFTNPRPFAGHFDVIQRNAIKSWLLLRKKCDVQIILFNDEQNTSVDIAKEFDIECVTNIACNENGTPLFNDVLTKARKLAKHDILAQVNSDIILMDDFPLAIKSIKESLGDKAFFTIGRRWDMDIKDTIEYDLKWQTSLKERISSEGKLHGLAGIDYWVFPQSFNFDPPSFSVGRPGIDSWLVYCARSQKIPVIDATDAITIVHQNHNYPMKKNGIFDSEKKRNIELGGGLMNMLTLRDADWHLCADGLKRPPFKKWASSKLSLFYPWRAMLALRRSLQNAR